MADEFGKWAFQSQAGISSGAQTVTLNGCYVKVGTSNELVYPIAVNTPLLISDGTANSETVTPTSVTQPTLVTGPSTISTYNCSFTATFANSHLNPGFGVSAGDGGLEAAMNYAIAKGNWDQAIEVVVIYGLKNGAKLLEEFPEGFQNLMLYLEKLRMMQQMQMAPPMPGPGGPGAPASGPEPPSAPPLPAGAPQPGPVPPVPGASLAPMTIQSEQTHDDRLNMPARLDHSPGAEGWLPVTAP
jgi:hypothetical protein